MLVHLSLVHRCRGEAHTHTQQLSSHVTIGRKVLRVLFVGFSVPNTDNKQVPTLNLPCITASSPTRSQRSHPTRYSVRVDLHRSRFSLSCTTFNIQCTRESHLRGTGRRTTRRYLYRSRSLAEHPWQLEMHECDLDEYSFHIILLLLYCYYILLLYNTII